MKKNIIILTAILLAFSSCSLKEDPIDSSVADEYYTTIIKCQTGVNSLYGNVRALLNGTGMIHTTECASDLMVMNLSTSLNAILDISPTKPGFATNLWQGCYEGIMKANNILYYLDEGVRTEKFTKEEAMGIKGEAIVLRSFFYYLLTSAFGDVPYYEERVTDENRRHIASLPRMSADATRDSLISQLQYHIFTEADGGIGAMELKRSYDGNHSNRMGAAAGLIIASKFCLWNERWEDAVKILGYLEDIYGHYADNPEQFGLDYPLTDIPYSQKYTRESIFEISNTYEPYGMQAVGNLASYTMPSKGSGDKYDGLYIPELGENAVISIQMRPTTWYYQTVMPYNSKDRRNGEYSNGATTPRGGSGNLAWKWKGYESDTTVRTADNLVVKWFSSCPRPIDRPWLGNKFWCYGMNSSSDFNNYKIFRYADACLMLAEAHLNLGDYAKAASYLNITRTRAGLDKVDLMYVGGSPESLMEEIRIERARELFGEYQRKFDLVRWGIWYERTVAFNDGKYLKGYIRPYHRFLPIPEDQITYSGGALNNDEYNR